VICGCSWLRTRDVLSTRTSTVTSRGISWHVVYLPQTTDCARCTIVRTYHALSRLRTVIHYPGLRIASVNSSCRYSMTASMLYQLCALFGIERGETMLCTMNWEWLWPISVYSCGPSFSSEWSHRHGVNIRRFGGCLWLCP
jgi:hypothetical protein